MVTYTMTPPYGEVKTLDVETDSDGNPVLTLALLDAILSAQGYVRDEETEGTP
jgi:hypothetical protein